LETCEHFPLHDAQTLIGRKNFHNQVRSDAVKRLQRLAIRSKGNPVQLKETEVGHNRDAPKVATKLRYRYSQTAWSRVIVDPLVQHEVIDLRQPAQPDG